MEEFLKRSGFSSQSSDGDTEDPDVKLRSYVRKFLALRMNKDVKTTDMIESQKKTVSFAVNQRKKHLDDKVISNIFFMLFLTLNFVYTGCHILISADKYLEKYE